MRLNLYKASSNENKKTNYPINCDYCSKKLYNFYKTKKLNNKLIIVCKTCAELF